MKRTELVRRTPLPPGKPLRRGGPVRAVSTRRAAENRQRKAAEAALVATLPGCWMCSRLDVEVHGHEIVGRAQGGDATKPDAMLCNADNEWCESFPVLAAWTGWKKSRKHPAMPCIASRECLPWAHRSLDCIGWTG